MRCPFCKTADSRVIDSRAADDGNTIRRRRECTSCGKRFTTYEVIEKIPLMVIKNDGRRVLFDRNKLLNGLIRSCDKRTVSMEKIINLTDEIEKELRNPMDREVSAVAIGQLVMEKLKAFDDVAYIRFASVYRKFTDISNFKEELEELIESKKNDSTKSKN
ncbi:transcriptional repressor NrdR [Propionispira arboris]|uniref:Transcriptional repressor NrdR n=1 Tax=Propionispira arboris TaxID=84035 RepID=A0A1H6W4V3_9FIRM|nr:transcriptional regulator NrdR [Propionispira arboris]SEJ11933.1 transcriptional repressor NrdR [Propionispira arboris]